MRCDHCGSALPEYGGIVADDERAEIRYNGKFVRNITGQEYLIFRALLNAKGRVVTRDAILTFVYSGRSISEDEMPELKIVDVFVCKLRKKLIPLGLVVKNYWGRGYALLEPGAS